jgi:hypothetical protein
MQCLTIVQVWRVVSDFQWLSEGQHHISRTEALWLALLGHADVFEAVYFWLMMIYVFCQSSRQRHFFAPSQQKKQNETIEDAATAGGVENVKIGHEVANIQCCHNWRHEDREIVNGHDSH